MGFVPQSRRMITRQHHPHGVRKTSQWVITAIFFALLFSMGTWTLLFMSGRITLGGVPSSIVMQFLQDDAARSAYFAGDGKKLHDRLGAMGIEEQMKTYYRPQFNDEQKLDQYIHQVLFERTGYIGANYQVNAQGVLVLKKPFVRDFTKGGE